MVDVPPERFEELVADAIDGIPDELAQLMENVAVFVEERQRVRGTLGLYQGIPLTERDAGYAGMVMPDRITIYRQPICAMCRDEHDVGRRRPRDRRRDRPRRPHPRDPARHARPAQRQRVPSGGAPPDPAAPSRQHSRPCPQSKPSLADSVKLGSRG